ncbi:MAG: hypothetical protein WBL44_10495 [Nitrososphaeraceae archaeon]
MHPPIVQEGQTGRESVEPTKAEECAMNPEHFNVSHWECSMFSADSLTELCANNP